VRDKGEIIADGDCYSLENKKPSILGDKREHPKKLTHSLSILENKGGKSHFFTSILL